jgi:hypothetical protein
MDGGLIGEGREFKNGDNRPVFAGYSSVNSISRPSIPGIYRSPFSGQDNQTKDGEFR